MIAARFDYDRYKRRSFCWWPRARWPFGLTPRRGRCFGRSGNKRREPAVTLPELDGARNNELLRALFGRFFISAMKIEPRRDVTVKADHVSFIVHPRASKVR